MHCGGCGASPAVSECDRCTTGLCRNCGAENCSSCGDARVCPECGCPCTSTQPATAAADTPSNTSMSRPSSPLRKPPPKQTAAAAAAARDGRRAERQVPLSQLESWLLAGCFAFFLFGNVAVDVWMAADVDLRQTGFALHQQVYEYGLQSDPLFLENSPYMRWSALATALLFLPYYLVMIWRLLVRGAGLPAAGPLHTYSWLFVWIMGTNMSIVLSLELFHFLQQDHLAPQLGPMLGTVGLYLLVPIWMANALCRNQQ